jgi:hypothetical protein
VRGSIGRPLVRYFERPAPTTPPLKWAEGEGETMTRIKAAAMALATACLLAGFSATASQQVPRTEPQGEGFIYNVGQGGIEACTAPGRQGECSMVKNVRLMLLSGTWVDGIGSFYKVALQIRRRSGLEVWTYWA